MALPLVLGLAIGQSCGPDDSCNAHRACEFGSLSGYNYVFNEVLRLTGCSEACVNECGCDSCNTSGTVYDALTRNPVLYCSANDVCKSPVVRRALNYDATRYSCDRVFSIALEGLYELCGTTNGMCQNGVCKDMDCITRVSDACRQESGVNEAGSYLVAFYAAVLFKLYLWANGHIWNQPSALLEKTTEEKPPSYEKSLDDYM